jgi:1-deoxy-D-xylulose-5-phosphate reductoisomerase
MTHISPSILTESPLASAALAAQTLTVLGSTGSVGTSTLDVAGRHPGIDVYGLSAHSNSDLLFAQCLQYRPCFAVLSDEQSAGALQLRLRCAGSDTEVLFGPAGLTQIATAAAVDTVMAAIVGAAGLLPALAAAQAGKKLLLANKESLVMAGKLFARAAAQSGAVILPIDSEHNAIFQCLPAAAQSSRLQLTEQGVRKVILTASGGPFLNTDQSELINVTPAQACKHPNWSMGRKISVDSATMMNKGLEFIEACYLFDLSPDKVEVLVHPQSIVHSMVEYLDGSVLAQLGSPDMRVPIAHGLAWPQRIASGANFLSLARSPDLQFFEPDLERFPCLALGMQVARQGDYAPVCLNAANEVAVEAFLQGQTRFVDIPRIISRTLEQITCREPVCIAMIQQIDLEARAVASEIVAALRS